MDNSFNVKNLSDQDVLEKLKKSLAEERHHMTRVLTLIAEVDRRKLYAQFAASSCFVFVTKYLGLSEGAAYKRIHVGRASVKYPIIINLVAQGKLHLSGLCVLVPKLTEQNHLELLTKAQGKSKRGIEKMLADYLAKQNLNKQQDLQKEPSSLAQSKNVSPVPRQKSPSGTALQSSVSQKRHNNSEKSSTSACTAQGLKSFLDVNPSNNEPVKNSGAPLPKATGLKSMGPNYYRLSITLSQKQHDKLKQAQALMASTKRGTDPAELFDQALDLLIERQSKRKYGMGTEPRKIKTVSSQSTAGKKSDLTGAGASSTITQVLPGEIASPPKKQADNTRAAYDKGESAKTKGTSAKTKGTSAKTKGTSAKTKGTSAKTKGTSAKTKGTSAKTKSRYIPMQVRRNVYKRDGGQCSYVDAMGKRCDSTYALQFHHRNPFAKGGKHSEANLEMRCPAHNELAARQDFGSTFIQHCITGKNGIQGPSPNS